MSSAQPKPDVVDSQGRPIPLGSVLGKGGEGTVYEIKQTTATVAKVYHKPLSQNSDDGRHADGRTGQANIVAG